MLPYLTQARAPLTREVSAINEFGEPAIVSIPAERALTVYVDKRELVTLMTLGAQPELLVLGFLRNQRLVQSVSEVDSITVDWDVGAAAVKTRRGISDIEKKTAKRVVTTGCGQGSMFGDLMADVDRLVLPPATLTQAQLYGIVNAMRLQESTYKSAGSVHGCALFQGEEMLMFVEDVGRHNAIDTIAGWMWMQKNVAMGGTDKVFYTTGRLTSEMDQVGPDGRADRGVAQRDHADGPGRGATPGFMHDRAGHPQALSLLQRCRAPAAATGAGRKQATGGAAFNDGCTRHRTGADAAKIHSMIIHGFMLSRENDLKQLAVIGPAQHAVTNARGLNPA